EHERRTRGARAMLNVDPPDHTRLRRLVSKAFTPRMIEGLRPLVERLVDEHLDAVAPTGRMDVIADLAFPLPFTVISEMLGMPDADRDLLRDWSHAIVKLLDPVISDDEVREAFVSSDHMTDHVHEVIAWKRAHPADDLLTALIRAEEDGDRLTPEELRDQVVLLFIAGHETTVNLIGNGTLALLRHPDQLTRWRDDPALDANAVDELLRYDAPVQFSRRITVAPLEIGGRTVPERTFVLAGLASANRDPARWGPTADHLDLGRSDAGQHVSFGSGTHFCLGAALARLEGQVAMGRLIRRFDALALADPGPEWNGRMNLRGLARLPVTFTPGRTPS
ncbi:MAG: cytochrome P450, partial [Acidimicrobiales bacterium]|nr:cytochrome P450 [Acidimicrobiales bacterium]